MLREIALPQAYVRRPRGSILFPRLGRTSAMYSSPSARWEFPTNRPCSSLAFRTKTSVAR